MRSSRSARCSARRSAPSRAGPPVASAAKGPAKPRPRPSCSPRPAVRSRRRLPAVRRMGRPEPIHPVSGIDVRERRRGLVLEGRREHRDRRRPAADDRRFPRHADSGAAPPRARSSAPTPRCRRCASLSAASPAREPHHHRHHQKRQERLQRDARHRVGYHDLGADPAGGVPAYLAAIVGTGSINAQFLFSATKARPSGSTTWQGTYRRT